MNFVCFLIENAQFMNNISPPFKINSTRYLDLVEKTSNDFLILVLLAAVLIKKKWKYEIQAKKEPL